jgi:Flp pilus assembly protein TadD
MPRTPASNTPMPRTPMPQTPTPPVMREADLVPEDHIVFDIDENVSREKYFTLGKQVAAALSIAIVSFISGYYLGGTNSTETTVVKTNYATTLAKTDLTTNKKATKPVPKKSPPKKAKPIPAPVKTTDELSSAVTNAQIDNNAAPATATVFQGKEIDIEQFDQRPNSAAATSTSQELSTDSNTDFSNTQTAPLDHESGTANFLPSPQGEETAALIAPAPTPASTDMTTTTATSTTTSVATAELVTTDAAPPKSEDDNLQNLMDQSLQAFQNKQWEALIELSDKILATDPGMVTALTNRAVANTELGSYLPALVDCNLAIKIEPKNPLAINNRGYVYEKMGDIKNAVADYEYACTLGIELSCKEAQRLQSKPIE